MLLGGINLSRWPRSACQAGGNTQRCCFDHQSGQWVETAAVAAIRQALFCWLQQTYCVTCMTVGASFEHITRPNQTTKHADFWNRAVGVWRYL